ncbi:MAG: flagellar M-ring protein FliF [Novosphingobium sp.]|nr:flagellar M-ring protein FliF [Novosphingobium sp.]
MADLVPAGTDGGAHLPPPSLPAPSLFAPFTDRSGGPILTRLGAFAAQPAIRKLLPAFVGFAAVGGALLAWAALAPSPQRVLYVQLGDADRAGVVAALDQAGIGYRIDSGSGALTVNKGDFYKARMLVASDGALATPESGDQMLDKLPMGASRTLEGQRLRSAREHDLQMTIAEIDGVDSVRVHIAEGEKSVFVRDNVPPTASVMVRLKAGRQLSESQVAAVVNLVAGSVPGLSPDAVKVVDQHGRLLSQGGGPEADRLDMQSRLEAKIRDQVSGLLTPVLGPDNFTTEAQVALAMDDVTSARESYDKDGVVRSETQEQSQSTGTGPAVGVPGVLSNTPPPAAQARPGPPQGTAPAAAATPPVNGESSSSRTYELGREVSVANTRPGGIKRLSVAVAVRSDALKGARAQEVQDIQSLVSAAVGADPQRGDQVKVIVRPFEPADDTALPFYEAPWFAMVVRNGAALLAVLLVLLLGVRPLIKAVRGDRTKGRKTRGDAAEDPVQLALERALEPSPDAVPLAGTLPHRPEIPGADGLDIDLRRTDLLSRQVNLAQRLVSEKPDSAVAALRQMINDPGSEDAGDVKAA